MTHRIYFAQHGLALNKADDPARPLAPTGVEQTRAIARLLQNSKIPVACIFHSGKLRAKQTAEIFADILNPPLLSTTKDLSPNDDVTLLAQNLNIDHALYIGHLPHLETLITYLLTNNINDHIIKLQNSAVTCLEKNNSHYQLQWYVTPELIKQTFQQP